MRRYNIVSGIFLILSIIGFALAAPVLVQEKRQACVDVARIPKDVTNVLGKRLGAEEIEELEAEYFKTWRNPFGSSDAHASTSSAPTGPDHEPTKPSNPKPSGFNWGFLKNLKDTLLPKPASSKEFGQAPENQAVHVVQPNPGPSTDLDFDWNHWMKKVNQEDLPPPRPASSKEIGQVPKNQAVHAVQSNPGSSADPDFDWALWSHRVNNEDLPPKDLPPINWGFKYYWKSLMKLMSSGYGGNTWIDPRPAPSKPSNPKLSDAGRSSLTKLDSGPNLMAAPQPLRIGPSNIAPPKEPEDKVLKPPSPESTDPVDHQSLSTDIQPELSPEDRQAAIYAAKGKAKVSRRISSTARDVGNAAHRLLKGRLIRGLQR